MVKVKDTASFIQRAIEVHGDRYDYSQTVYTKANNSIAFKCRKCQRNIGTKAARKHIDEKIRSGCGRCFRTPMLTKEQRLELKKRECKICGKPINNSDRRKVTCSKKCGYVSQRKPRAIVKCCVCGKEVHRIPSKVREINCCSNTCQKTRAGMCGKDWVARSAEAKKRHKSASTRKRKIGSVSYNFWLMCKLPTEANANDWRARCDSSSSTLKERFVGEIRKRKRIKTWKKCFVHSTRKLCDKSKRDQREGWEWKIESVANGLRRRRRKKSLQQGKRNICRHIKQQARLPRQLSFWG